MGFHNLYRQNIECLKASIILTLALLISIDVNAEAKVYEGTRKKKIINQNGDHQTCFYFKYFLLEDKPLIVLTDALGMDTEISALKDMPIDSLLDILQIMEE